MDFLSKASSITAEKSIVTSEKSAESLAQSFPDETGTQMFIMGVAEPCCCTAYKLLSQDPPQVTALSSSTCQRIEPLEFDACISGAELPVDCTDLLVAMSLPTLNLLT
jgi:hypothetical protein